MMMVLKLMVYCIIISGHPFRNVDGGEHNEAGGVMVKTLVECQMKLKVKKVFVMKMVAE